MESFTETSEFPEEEEEVDPRIQVGLTHFKYDWSLFFHLQNANVSVCLVPLARLLYAWWTLGMGG